LLVIPAQAGTQPVKTMPRFIILFAIVVIVLFALELTAPAQRYVIQPWTDALGAAGGAVSRWFDPNVVTQGATIMNPATGFGVTIVAGCNGVEATLILIAALLAYPAPWKHRLIGFAAGVVAIQALNLVRVVSLFYLGQWSFPAFEFAHLYVWQALIMIDVLVVWLVWLRTLPRVPAHEPA
jgi:exosortase H (IPTLxxWG-CTERM-specific)